MNNSNLGTPVNWMCWLSGDIQKAHTLKVNFFFAWSTSNFPNQQWLLCEIHLYQKLIIHLNTYVPHSYHMVDVWRTPEKFIRQIGAESRCTMQTQVKTKCVQIIPNCVNTFLRLPEFTGAGGQGNHRFRWKPYICVQTISEMPFWIF